VQSLSGTHQFFCCVCLCSFHILQQSLKLSLDWCISRNQWYEQAYAIRARFRENMDETDPRRIAKLLKETDTLLERNYHPEPYIFPDSPGGSKYQRNSPAKSDEDGWGVGDFDSDDHLLTI